MCRQMRTGICVTHATPPPPQLYLVQEQIIQKWLHMVNRRNPNANKNDTRKRRFFESLQHTLTKSLAQS